MKTDKVVSLEKLREEIDKEIREERKREVQAEYDRRHKYYIFNEAQMAIILCLAFAFALSIIEQEYPKIFPKITCPSTYSELKNYKSCESKVSLSFIIKMTILVVAGFMFRNEFQFVVLSMFCFQLAEEFFEIDEECRTFKKVGGAKPYIFGNFTYNMYGG